MNCFEGVPPATDAAVKVGLEELKSDLSQVQMESSSFRSHAAIRGPGKYSNGGCRLAVT